MLLHTNKLYDAINQKNTVWIFSGMITANHIQFSLVFMYTWTINQWGYHVLPSETLIQKSAIWLDGQM